MFGAEGNRIAAMRQQQQQQYAEELRRQIEEKQNKAIRQKKTPPAYSTTQNDSMQDTVNSINYNNNTTTTNNSTNNNITNSPNGSFNVRPPNMARQNQAPPRSNYFNSPNRNIENNINDNTYNQTNNFPNDNDSNFNNNRITSTNYSNNYGNREDYYSIPTTSTIAPLALNVQPPSSIMTTTYMLGPTSAMTRGTLNADRSTFPSRVDSLESRIFNLRDELASRTEKVNNFNDSIFPSINRDISDLRNRIETESSHDIPQQIQPIRNSIKNSRNSIENINQNQREVHSNISSTFSELNGKINTFVPLFNDFQENSKTSFVSLRGDINRHRNQLETSNAKIGKIETQDISIISNLSAVNEDFNESDKLLSSNFESLQISTNDIMQSITSQLAYDIQNESQNRDKVSTKLQSQVSEVNDRSKSAISRLVENIRQLDFKDSLDEISKQISNAVNLTNNDTDVKATDLTRKFDTFLADCEDNFGSIQNETVSTIEATKANHLNSMEVLENSLEEESRIRSKNANEITAKYAQFRELIQQEEKIQMENCNRTFSDISFQLKNSINDHLTPMYKDVHGAVYLISHIEETEAKLEKLEKMVTDTNRNISDKMNAFQNQFKKLMNEVTFEKNTMTKQLDEIERRINNLQQSNGKKMAVKRTEIHAIQKEIEIGLDQKVTMIEEEIAQIMNQIAQIQFASDNHETNEKTKRSKNKNISKTDNRTEGAIMLESLVNETSNKAKTTSSPSSARNQKKKHIFGEQDNSLFLTNNKTLEIQSDTENNEDDTNNNNNDNYSKIGSNVMLETCQRFHFVPPENIFDQKGENDNENKKENNLNQNVRKKASTVRFNLNPTNENNSEDNNNNNNVDNDENKNNAAPKKKKYHSMPKIDIESESNQSKPKFKVDTSFSSNSIKQGVSSLKQPVNDSMSVSNSSSSANQIDETPLSPKDVKLPFARTNEIEQMLKPEALATLPPPHSLSQIIESSSKNIFSDEDNNNNNNSNSKNFEEEEEEAEVENENNENNNNVASNLTDLEKTPPQLALGGKDFEGFKFNPGDFKIDLGLNNKKDDDRNKIDQILNRVDKIVSEVNDKNEGVDIEEEEEVKDDEDDEVVNKNDILTDINDDE